MRAFRPLNHYLISAIALAVAGLLTCVALYLAPTARAASAQPTGAVALSDVVVPTAPTGPAAPTGPTGPVAYIGPDGRRAIAPAGAPRIVRRAINAANRLTTKPYRYGGGHASFSDGAYDCSGSVSYVLHAIRRLDRTYVSGDFKRWGLEGAGEWITIYANKGHVFMVIAGLRFDTSGGGESGPRWRSETRWFDGFRVRHPQGL